MSQEPKDFSKQSETKSTEVSKVNASVTGQVMRLVYGSENKAAIHEKFEVHDVEEEEEVEVDERWLMTYADKMTILCGLFIMLFAMSNMDKVKLQRVKDSTEKSFGKATKEVEKKFVETDDGKALKAQLAAAQEVITKLQAQTITTTTRIAELEKQIQEKTVAQSSAISTARQIQKLKDANARLQEKTEEPTFKPEPTTPDLTPQLRKAKRENEQMKEQFAVQQQKIKQATEEIQQLKLKMSNVEAAEEKAAFMAFMMKWPTNNHDLDLRVEDPSGHRFDFKHRKYEDHPGTFVLDTRRGPGMEVWQSDRMVPGTYKFTYLFYNAYGNNEPCPVSGTLFTSRGSIELPKVTLDPAGKREASFQIKIDKEGKASVE